MKKILMLALALIAVGPFALEGQTAGQRALTNIMLDSRRCEVDAGDGQEACVYVLPGLEFQVSLESGHVIVMPGGDPRGDDLAMLGLMRGFNGIIISMNQLSTDRSVEIFMCLSPPSTGRFVYGPNDCP